MNLKYFDKIFDLMNSNKSINNQISEIKKELYDCFKNKNCDYLIFFIEEFKNLKEKNEKEKEKIINVGLIEDLLINAFKENVEKEDSKTLIEKLIKNKNNINIELIVIVINNNNIMFDENDFYNSKISYDEDFLLFLSDNKLLNPKIINKCMRLESILKFYEDKKNKILNKNMKIQEMMKFKNFVPQNYNNFDDQILTKKIKLIDIYSINKQEQKLKNIYDDFNKRLEEINEMEIKINNQNNTFFENCVDNKIEEERQKIQNILENEEIDSLNGEEIKKFEKFIKDELEKLKKYENYSKSFIFTNNIYKKKIDKNKKITYEEVMNNLKVSVEDYNKIYKMLNENDNLKIDLDFIKECFLNVEDLTKELNLIAENNNLNNKNEFVITQKKILNVLKDLSVAHERLQYFFMH